MSLSTVNQGIPYTGLKVFLPQCKLGTSLRCERVDVDFEAIKTEEFIIIEGIEFKRAEAREEAEKETKAGMYSFIAHETGGLAVFMIDHTQDDHNRLDAKITLNSTGRNNYFVLDSCGPDCEILTQFEKRPKVRVTSSDNIFFTHIFYFLDKVERVPRQPVTAVSRTDGKPIFTNQGPADCRDSLDYTLCGYLANVGQCALMNTIGAFGIFTPCPATCGTCEWYTKNFTTYYGVFEPKLG